MDRLILLLLIIIIITIIIIIIENDDGITQEAFQQSGSSSTWGINGFALISKDGVAKEAHPNIQPHGQAGNRTLSTLPSLSFN